MRLLQNFLTVGESKSARCDDLESLKKRNCNVAKIENPRGGVTVNKNKPVTNRKKDNEKMQADQITQIQPQKLTVTLRSGKYSALVAVGALSEQVKTLVHMFYSVFLCEKCFWKRQTLSLIVVFLPEYISNTTNLNTRFNVTVIIIIFCPKGEPQTFQLKFKRAEDYPIDLYYLMDLSFSMEDDLENLKNLGTELMREMQAITSDFRIGKDSFLK